MTRAELLGTLADLLDLHGHCRDGDGDLIKGCSLWSDLGDLIEDAES